MCGPATVLTVLRYGSRDTKADKATFERQVELGRIRRIKSYPHWRLTEKGADHIAALETKESGAPYTPRRYFNQARR